MNTSPRLELAIKKLYTAFHNNTLHPECCRQCAVGNILDNTDIWKHFSNDHGSLTLSYVGRVHQTLGRTFNGYSPVQLLTVEHIFLNACGFKLPLHYNNYKPENPTDKDILFKGLCAVVAYLCELDAIKNVMDYTKLFEVAPKKELHLKLA